MSIEIRNDIECPQCGFKSAYALTQSVCTADYYKCWRCGWERYEFGDSMVSYLGYGWRLIAAPVGIIWDRLSDVHDRRNVVADLRFQITSDEAHTIAIFSVDESALELKIHYMSPGASMGPILLFLETCPILPPDFSLDIAGSGRWRIPTSWYPTDGQMVDDDWIDPYDTR